MKPKINIITLAVDDLNNAITFYRDGLGLPAKESNFGGDHMLFELHNNLSLVLYLRKELDIIKDQSNTNPKSSEFILSYIAEEKNEVDSILNKAAEAGGTILTNQPIEYSWGYSGHFKDPDGHIWEVVYFK